MMSPAQNCLQNSSISTAHNHDWRPRDTQPGGHRARHCTGQGQGRGLSLQSLPIISEETGSLRKEKAAACSPGSLSTHWHLLR